MTTILAGDTQWIARKIEFSIGTTPCLPCQSGAGFCDHAAHVPSDVALSMGSINKLSQFGQID
jgi:hypothetical protein